MATASPLVPTSTDLEPAALLGVTRSIKGFRWIERLDGKGLNEAAAMAQRHALPEIVTRLLAGRGVASDEAERFLEPTLRALLPDPSRLRDMDKGAERFAKAIHDRETIAVLGDYDVDGAASVALVGRFLRMYGLPVKAYIPDRLTEGYGASPDAMRTLAEHGASLILTVDCGATSADAISAANDAGADVIVLDHHPPGETLPPAFAIIDPNREDDLSGQGHLAAAGVVFLFLVATARVLRASGEEQAPDLLAWLDLVALATICDLVPLKGLNRAFVTQGLKILRMRQNAGLRALADRAGLREAPHAGTLGFILGPRINAGGRIGECGLGADLLATDDEIQAGCIADTLERLNVERRAIEVGIFEEAQMRADTALAARPDAPMLAIAGDGWHPGVLGLVASRLVERFAVPALVIGWGRDGTGTGSARSVPEVDIGRAIREAAEQGLLLKGGGHAMAGGVTLLRDRFAPAVAHIEQSLQKRRMSSGAAPRTLLLDGALSVAAVTPDLIGELERIGPYGSGHPEPRFAFASLRPLAAQVVGGEHVRCTLQDGRGDRIEAIAFRAANASLGQSLLRARSAPLHVAGQPKHEIWRGNGRIRLVIEDAAEPGGAPCDDG